ncbi:DUF4062 domain-containing protein [Thermomonospora amylolytica]|uniref:DUF4062 domain-containing protein n=1 Tax=Thermomonospora amylolytica TaxID=1411117 RepID=UPI000E6B6093|nr:DUF4062 domain-containing protein [Thermomonospora amylolytica]
MRVFISSVRRGLESERDHLPALLRAVGYEPKVFEEFTAQLVPSRDAVIAAAESADVVVLLLGHIYGDPLKDSGVATTEEEFLVAKRRGIPILVFKKRGIDPEPRQQEFIERVGNYVQGRFWKEFDSASDLGVAVLEALGEIKKLSAPLEWTPMSSEPPKWRSERPYIADAPNVTNPPVLEVHLLSVTDHNVLSVSDLEPLQRRLVRAAREVGIFADTASVTSNSDVTSAWASTVISDDRQTGAITQIRYGGLSGLVVDRTGSVLVFKPLPRDLIGSLINQESLAEDLAVLLRLAAELVPSSIRYVVPVAAIDPSDNLREGDPGNLGRSSGPIALGNDGPLRTEVEDAVQVDAFPGAALEVGKELAARLIATLRMRQPW